MRVTNINSQPTQAAGEAAAAKATRSSNQKSKTATSAPSRATDGAKAEISGKGREAAQAREIASKTPDVREEKIAALKQRIAEGKYKVDADAIADKMVDEHLGHQSLASSGLS